MSMTQQEKTDAMDAARLSCEYHWSNPVHTCFYICTEDGCDERYDDDADPMHCQGHRAAA